MIIDEIIQWALNNPEASTIMIAYLVVTGVQLINFILISLFTGLFKKSSEKGSKQPVIHNPQNPSQRGVLTSSIAADTTPKYYKNGDGYLELKGGKNGFK